MAGGVEGGVGRVRDFKGGEDEGKWGRREGNHGERMIREGRGASHALPSLSYLSLPSVPFLLSFVPFLSLPPLTLLRCFWHRPNNFFTQFCKVYMNQ